MSEFKTQHNIIEYVITLLDESKIDGASESKSDRDTRLETAYEIQNFLDEIPGGFLIYFAEGNEDIIYANAALIRIFGCESLREFKELTRNTFKGIVHPDDLESVEKSISNQIFEKKSDLDFVEYRIIRKDGSVRWVEDYGHYIKSAGLGNIFYVFISDITAKKERELAEKAMLIAQKNEREQKIKTLVEEYDRERKIISREHLRRLEVIEGLSVNYDTIVYADFDAGTVYPYRQGNRVFRQFEGESRPRELNWYLNDYVENIVCPKDRERIAQVTNPDYIRKKLTECKTYYANYVGGVNGIMQHLQIRIVNVGSSERVSQVVIGYRNIDEEVRHETEHMKALEAALHTAKQAEIARNTFLSNMSHDLRTPLNALFGYTALAKSKTDNEEIVDYLDKINDASRQMYELIDKLLEISYIESNEITIKERECNICDVINRAYDYALPNASKKEVACTVRCTDIKHSDVFADGDKIKQVLDYILGNAVKYTPSGGKVIITAEECGAISNGYATYKISVKDTGIGIKPATLPHIFDPFKRENNTTVSGVFGIGLGLTISKTIIEMMGGAIDVESEEGVGSTFTVTVSLRVIDENSRHDTDTDRIINKLKGKRILVVEDNEINLEIITEILESYDFKVDSVTNGQMAVDKVSSAPPDYYEFILMDIQMPVLDGRQATRLIRKLDDKKKANLPIIAISANAFESDKRESIDAGMDAHLNKPLDVSALLQTIASVLTAHKHKA